jgi:hypothetical protein
MLSKNGNSVVEDEELGWPRGDACGVEDPGLWGVRTGPATAKLTQDKLLLVLKLYGALTDLARRRPVKEGEEEMR